MRYFRFKHAKWTIAILISCFLLVGLTAANASLVVIGNPHLKLQSLTKKQLAAIYLGQTPKLGKKVQVQPYDLPSGTEAYSEFYKQILGWSPGQVAEYWSAQTFGNGNSQPSANEDAAAAVATVEHTPGAIAYVDSQALSKIHGKFKVLYGHYKAPADNTSSDNATAQDQNAAAVRREQALGFHSVNQQVAPQTSDNSKSILAKAGSHQAASTHKSAPAKKTRFAAGAASASPSNSASTSALTQAFASAATYQDDNNIQQSGNLWDTISRQLNVAHAATIPAVKRQVRWYLRHRHGVENILNNATPYIYYVYKETQKRHMPAIFALLPMIESAYNPYAYSSAGAAGLWQMMPGTASSYGLDIDWWHDARRDVVTSTNSALNYLVRLHNNLGSWYLALAGYNAGGGAVRAAMHYNRDHHRATDYWALPLPLQTRNYVPKLLALAILIKKHRAYDIQLPSVPNRPYFVAFKMKSQLDIREIAQLAGISTTMVHELNPGFRRFATQPDSEYTLLIPVTHATLFARNLAHVKGKTHVSWQYHEVQNRDTLSTIAHNYHTTAALLRRVNHLKTNQLHAGASILVPIHLNKTYQLPVGSSRNIDKVTHAQSVVATKLNKTLASINHSKAAKINATDILSGLRSGFTESAADFLHGKHQQAVPAKQKTQSTATAATAIPSAQPVANNDDSLKAVIKKIYGSD